MYNAPRGTADILPEDQAYWRYIEEKISYICQLYGYARIETPIFEETQLFVKGTGDTTDVVQKEMYSFEDRSGNSLTLKPEGTPGVCRAYLEHGFQNLPQPVKLYHISPFFRYERPQAGRYRQYYSFGAEAIGEAPAGGHAAAAATAAPASIHDILTMKEPGLVAFLGLNVEPELRELPVGVDLARRQPGDDLFVGHRQDHVGALAVLETEELVADGLPAAGLLPDLGRVEDRVEHLLTADRLHLLADHGLDLAHDAPARRQEDVDARRELADEPGAHHELVAGGLGSGRVLFDGRKQELTGAHAGLPICRPAPAGRLWV